MKNEYIIKMLTDAEHHIDEALEALKGNDTKTFECHLQMSKDAIKCATNMHGLSKMQKMSIC